LLPAQNHVKITKDFTDGGVVFFTGEIYVYDTAQKMLVVNGKTYNPGDNVQLHNENVQQLKNPEKFIRKIKGGFIQVDVSSILNNGDTVWLADATHKMTPFVTNKKVTKKSDELGKAFRLIIPGTVTVWYNQSSGNLLLWILTVTGAMFLLVMAIRNRKKLRAIVKRKNVSPNNSRRPADAVNPSQDLEAQLKTANSKISRLLQENTNLANVNSDLEAQLISISEKVVSVGFLQNYAESIYSYLRFCEEVKQRAGNYYDRIVLRNDYNAATVACLLQKFHNSIGDIPVNDWLQIIEDIRETGLTVNRQLIRIIAQPESNSEKQRELRRTLFREIIIRYSSNILILAESFRNLAGFGIDAAFAGEAELDFGKYVAGIVNRAKTVDMEIRYVPLFEKYDKYSAIVEPVNQKQSFPYREVQGLQRNDMAEIVSYGVKTEFEDIKTQIILGIENFEN
jgi:hypothetical protein